ncbi:cob(I)yrinic acid a,c-diamide adenosyltransferase [Gordonia polyisoprenivorans]|uniref:cob(I)yrinic acid a,c-diamide adenosyltransferase n=1 Tax=Gordonia polyisoprenivorans TaxID=84595 RepID=UPI001AD72569|nr:cob(I)yrinic acid a,c-diamide adenosyltransferase [Gordonia polyisoprenivorans]QTI71347.1 cob(I)yrinic acid a,c-diamide adenosyltransferase [Gordonia polyisoprenivorans]
MAVHLTRIYTRTGDDGTTGLSDFSRVSKTDPRVVAYADCDEANAAIGAALSLGGSVPDDIATVLRTVQNDLFDAGADLSTPVVEDPKYPPLRVEQDYIDALERWCDAFGEPLPSLDSFILPGGSPLSALLHQARTVTRRAERSAWAAVDADPEATSVLPARYLNRLSDLLFILSRVANRPPHGDGDVTWVPGGQRHRPDETASD